MQPVRIIVVGTSTSGKKTLATCLNVVHRRRYDGGSFVLEAKAPADIPTELDDVDFILAAFPLGDITCLELASAANDLVKQAIETSAHPPSICLVGTKSDLVKNDYSDVDLATRCLRAECAYEFDREYVAVSSHSGSGIPDLCELIVNKLYPPTRENAAPSLKRIVSHLGTWALDALASVFSLPVPQDVNRDTPDPQELDVATLQSSWEDGQIAKEWEEHFSQFAKPVLGGRISSRKITSGLIAKRTTSHELTNTLFVRRHTKIPVPQPRYLHLGPTWLVQDFVRGRMLLECWSSLGFIMQFRVACTLRGYVSQLRKLRGTIPGSVEEGHTGGVLFDDIQCGPFPSLRSFKIFCEEVAWHAWEMAVRYHLKMVPQEPVPPPPIEGDVKEWSLVFTHTDLNLGNLILSDDGVLWVIDWASSGFYPRWLETVGMDAYGGPQSWRRYRWFMAGLYPRWESLWHRVMQDVHRYSLEML